MWPRSHLYAQALLAAAVAAQRTQSIWGQCGGSGYTGLSRCPQTAYCNYGNPWYSQCIPGSVDEPLPGVPDSPLVTNTIQTIITVAPGPDPIVVTTFITYLTPSSTTTSGPAYTVIDGTTFIILPNGPVTKFIDARAPKPTAPPRVEAREPAPEPKPEPDVDRAPVADSPIEVVDERAVAAAAAVEARDFDRAPVYDTAVEAADSRVEARDVDRPPVYDSPIESTDAGALERRDVDRPPVYDTPITPGQGVKQRDVDKAPVYDSVIGGAGRRRARRDVDRPPVYDTPISPAGDIEKRDVDRPPVYDTPITPTDNNIEKRDVDRPPVYDTPIIPTNNNIEKRDVDRPPVYDTPIAPLEDVEKRDVDRAPVYDAPLEKFVRAAAAVMAPTPTILAKGQYWIRAVAAPNFHKYLQTKVANTAAVAILGLSKTAGQFSIQGGQLVEATGGDPLYLQVERPADMTQRTLATWFNSTKNEFGAFAWQGDTLVWTAAEVKRQNAAAWLVCKDQALFINTGAYAYQTPAGCSDQTIHYYNDATAND